MECDGAGGSLAQNFFALQFTGTSFDGNNDYISNTSASRTLLEAALPGDGEGTFRIIIHIDSATANYGQQSTWVNFTFTAT